MMKTYWLVGYYDTTSSVDAETNTDTVKSTETPKTGTSHTITNVKPDPHEKGTSIFCFHRCSLNIRYHTYSKHLNK